MLPLILALACASEPQPAAEPAAAPPAAEAPAAEAPAAEEAPPPPGEGAGPGFPPDSPEGQALAKAKGAGKAMGGALKAELKAAIEQGGPPTGITVCNEKAPAIAASVASEQGVKIGRSSLRLRNPDNAGPEWVQAWLQAKGETKAEGMTPDAMIEEVDGQRVARVAVPIAVESVCLACHGATDTMDDAVKATLAEKYPQDKATGYELGDLRGVLWVEAPVAAAEGGEGQPSTGSEG